MHGFWLFVHIVGFSLWLGGGLASMVAGVAAKSFAPETRLAAYRVLGAVQRILVGPGAVAVLLSGFILSTTYMQSGSVPGWLMLMMVAGLVAGILALALTVPTAAQLGRLQTDPRGELPESFAGLRKRLVIAASISGLLALVALFAGTVLR
jgi:hypothetical protein